MTQHGQHNGCDPCECGGYARPIECLSRGDDDKRLRAVECMDCRLFGPLRKTDAEATIAWNKERMEKK